MTSPAPSAAMNVEVLVPNSQSDSQTSNVQSVEDKKSFTSITTIATPPSSQSPKPRDAQQESFIQPEQPARVSPTRPFTPALEVPRSQSSSPSSRSSKSPIIGKKRTANGLIKTTNEAAMSSPATIPGSARRESVSSSGRISELSKQLKTRLTYAMVKVQNGWEQHSIDQVENIVATQLTSPASLMNGVQRGQYQSPREVMNRNRRSRDLSFPMSAQANMASITSSAPSAGWSSYQRNATGYGPVLNAAGSGLQPAPELTSAPRKHYAEDRMSESSGSSGNMAPRYAPKPITHARTASLRANTPTQQEQDAIETLLGMSSPGPSVNFANSQTTSPKRAEFAVPQQHNRPGYGVRRPSLVGSRSMSSEELENVAASRRAHNDDSEQQAKRRSFGVLKSSKDVDDLLDQIADAADTDDEDEDNTATLRSQIPVPAVTRS